MRTMIGVTLIFIGAGLNGAAWAISNEALAYIGYFIGVFGGIVWRSDLRNW